MCWKVDELCRAMTADELGALEMLAQAKGKDGGSREMPFAMMQRLMGLGLVELCCGGLDLTVAGRLALASMQAYEPRYGEAGTA